MKTVIALAGRRIDAPFAVQPRFPLPNVAAVKEELKAYFSGRSATALVCSAACGADLVALEAAGELGIWRTIVLPFPGSVFKPMSVTDCPGEWGDPFDKICREVQHEGGIVMLDYSTQDGHAFTNTNNEILNHAQQVLSANTGNQAAKGQVVALLVWDGKLKPTGDTTGHFGEEARKRGFKVEELYTLK